MPDKWDRVDGDQAVEIEHLNYDNQVNFIKSLFYFWQCQKERDHKSYFQHPTEDALKDLHRLGTLLLLDSPGSYRTGRGIVRDTHNRIVHEGPPAKLVPEYMEKMFLHLDKIWNVQEGHEIAAYLLWRINWIHPFSNGNGRTARGFAYACMCLKAETIFPGRHTVIDLIKNDREPLYKCLQEADRIYERSRGQTVDVRKLADYLLSLLERQLEGIDPTPPSGKIPYWLWPLVLFGAVSYGIIMSLLSRTRPETK